MNLYDSRPYFEESEWNEHGRLISIFTQIQKKKKKYHRNKNPKSGSFKICLRGYCLIYGLYIYLCQALYFWDVREHKSKKKKLKKTTTNKQTNIQTNPKVIAIRMIRTNTFEKFWYHFIDSYMNTRLPKILSSISQGYH